MAKLRNNTLRKRSENPRTSGANQGEQKKKSKREIGCVEDLRRSLYVLNHLTNSIIKPVHEKRKVYIFW